MPAAAAADAPADAAADAVVLEASGLARSVGGRCVWSGLGVRVAPGECWFVRGPSGIGKTLLLRALACLDPLEAGTLRLHGRSPSEVGVPAWRTQVMYVHQSRVNFKGCPADLFAKVQSFGSQKGRPRGDLPSLLDGMGLDPAVLQQPWAELSGGQAQRVALAIAIALQPQVLLLDEPTSACDAEATRRVEAVLQACPCALLWVTHDPLQPGRVGGRMLELPSGAVSTIARALQPQQQGGAEAAAAAEAAAEAAVAAAGLASARSDASSGSSSRASLQAVAA